MSSRIPIPIFLTFTGSEFLCFDAPSCVQLRASRIIGEYLNKQVELKSNQNASASVDDENESAQEFSVAAVVPWLPLLLMPEAVYCLLSLRLPELDIKIFDSRKLSNACLHGELGESMASRLRNLAAAAAAVTRNDSERRLKALERTGGKLNADNLPTEAKLAHLSVEARRVEERRQRSMELSHSNSTFFLASKHFPGEANRIRISIPVAEPNEFNEIYRMEHKLVEENLMNSLKKCNFALNDIPFHSAVVYRDLYSRGYYLTSGIQFGGHFLLYHRDPTQIHAGCIVVIRRWRDSQAASLFACQNPPLDGKIRENSDFTGLELMELARIGQAARKSIVIATVKPMAMAMENSNQNNDRLEFAVDSPFNCFPFVSSEVSYFTWNWNSQLTRIANGKNFNNR